jgi:Leucine-rich repeat (LRR) protein
MLSLNDAVIQSVIDKYGPKISKLKLSKNGKHRRFNIAMFIAFFHTGLEDVEKLSIFRETLVKLSLQQNMLKDVSSISSLTNLIELDLSENQL